MSDEADPAPRFAPYESALKHFKDYRHHPSHENFRSLTYSHNIDNTKPLCQFESTGGKCNNPKCEGQHIGSMGISGPCIL